MTYKNPILLCDYSDPDVCRAGDDFYLTASSFNFVPALPVLHSRDLVHWTLINYALPSIPLPGYDKVQNAKGVWAPSIRFHEGRFYIFFATPDEGIFYTSTADPYGKWDELQCVWAGKGFEDPCPFWDDDGKVYLVHAYVKSRVGFNSKLGIFELDPRTLKPVTEDKFIFDGTQSQPTIEGPKVYKRNGFYYIFAPAGGVTNGWQSVLRSKKIDGDYEEKIVLAQGDSKINGPHQGGWVQTQSGEDWFIHFQDAGIFGRITHLQPMRWISDWPVMGNAVLLSDEKALSVTGEPVTKWKIPLKNKTGFSKQEISEFQFSASPDENNFASTKNSLWLTPSVCTKKINSKKFTYEKRFFLEEKWHENQRRGIIFLGNEYAALQIEKSDENTFVISYLESSGSENGDTLREEKIIWKQEISLEEQLTAKSEVLPECLNGGNFAAFESDSTKKRRQVCFKMKFSSGKDGKSGIVHFSAKAKINGKKIAYKSKPFKTTNAHWVGGRYGFFS
ncbi:glycoside hydrolase 43 family protein [Treponema sp.]|uniref:glycoside hydrolase 43 family protein n=1 Tax=Treponema sp. TaxID=166 RepID=UPI003890675B